MNGGLLVLLEPDNVDARMGTIILEIKDLPAYELPCFDPQKWLANKLIKRGAALLASHALHAVISREDSVFPCNSGHLNATNAARASASSARCSEPEHLCQFALASASPLIGIFSSLATLL